MDTVLLRAILAMDAYNQGCGAGITEVGSQIGSATRVQDSSMLRDAEGKSLDHGIGFYAAAYQLADGSKIISYRGTDNAGASSASRCCRATRGTGTQPGPCSAPPLHPRSRPSAAPMLLISATPLRARAGILTRQWRSRPGKTPAHRILLRGDAPAGDAGGGVGANFHRAPERGWVRAARVVLRESRRPPRPQPNDLETSPLRLFARGGVAGLADPPWPR